jgi:hypothetical protein
MADIDDLDIMERQDALDGPAGMALRSGKLYPLDPAHEDWVPDTVEGISEESRDDPSDTDDGDNVSSIQPDDSIGGVGDDGSGEDGEDQNGLADLPEDSQGRPLIPRVGDGVYGPPLVQEKRRRGRPRKQPSKSATENPREKRADQTRKSINGVDRGGENAVKYFPKPPAYFFKDDNAGDSRRPPAFFRYLAQVAEDPELSSRIMLYVYRSWPVMLPEGRQQEKTADILQYGDIEHRYGMGDYHIKLNDAKIGKTIAMVNVTGLRNEEYPAVLDISKVDTADPANRSWMARQRAKGIRFEGDDPDTSNKENNMAEVAAVQALTGSLEKMVGKVADMADKQRNSPEPTRSVDQEAVSKGLDIVAQAANMGNQMMQTAITRLTEQSGKNPDPLEMMERSFSMAKDFLEAAKADTPVVAANDHSQIIEIMRMQQEQQQKFHDLLFQMQQGQINELKAALAKRDEQQSTALVAAQQPKTIIEQLNEIKAAKETFRDVLGLEEGGGDKQSWLAENAPMLIQGLSVLGAVISTGLYNLAVIKTGQGQPAPPPGPDAILTPEQQENLRQHGVPVGGVGGVGQTPTSQPAQATPTMAGDDMLTQYHQFLKMIEPSLLKAFQEGATGDEYAETMIQLGDNGYFGPQLTGSQVYSMVSENGKSAIMALIKTYPPIWNVVKLTPQKWEDFMTAFFNAPDIWAKQDEESENGANRAG